MLLVSIHDVTPALERQVRALWGYCTERGIVPALLVVPNWHGAWPLKACGEFVEWLHDCGARGADLVLHGQRHDEHGLPRGLLDGFRTWGRTAREGEFLTFTRQTALHRIRSGVDSLREVGLTPIGFVPPAWLMRAEARLAVGDAGLRFTEDAKTVLIFPRGERLRAPAVRWSARTPLRALASKWIADWKWELHRDERLVRLALHPQDLSRRATERSVLQALDRWLTKHTLIRYAALVG